MDVETFFFVRPDLLIVLKSIEDIPSHKKVFKYQEIDLILKRYFKIHHNKFFAKDTTTADITGSLLEKALLHNKLSKSDYKFLVKLQLIQVSTENL